MAKADRREALAHDERSVYQHAARHEFCSDERGIHKHDPRGTYSAVLRDDPISPTIFIVGIGIVGTSQIGE